jgi:TRAP transporter TAXI family solute receptor
VQFRAIIITASTAAAIMLAPAHSASGADKLISVGTGGINGVYFPLGGAICRQVEAGRRDHGFRCMVESTEGSVSNINAVLSGELDLGLAQGDAQYTAVEGLGPFKDRPQPKLRALFSLYPELFTVVARMDAGINRLEDLQDKRIYAGEPGSATHAIADLVFASLDEKPRYAQPASMSPAELAAALCENRIDAFAIIAGHPNASVQQAANSCATNIVAVAGPVIDRLIREHPVLARASVPGGIYKGAERAQTSFGVFATLVASADLPEATAYLVTKAVFEHFDAFKRSHPALANISRESMLAGSTAPIHPGALRYLREQGMVK